MKYVMAILLMKELFSLGIGFEYLPENVFLLMKKKEEILEYYMYMFQQLIK